jgi:hypothetical protein
MVLVEPRIDPYGLVEIALGANLAHSSTKLQIATLET